MTGVMTMTSERKRRYFQGRKTGVVVRAVNEAHALDLDRQPAMTEVQVVPIDAIVISRDELPEVSDFGPDGPTAYLATVAGAEVYAGNTADDTHLWGLRYLALSEYLREHSPVDEALRSVVGKIPGDIADDLAKGRGGVDRLATWLADHGVRVEQP